MKPVLALLAVASLSLSACALDGASPERIDVAASEPVSGEEHVAPPEASLALAEAVVTPPAPDLADATCTRKGALCAVDEPRSDEELATCRAAAVDATCGQAFRDMKRCEERDVKCDAQGARLERYVCVEETSRWIDCTIAAHHELEKADLPLITVPR